MRVGLILMLVLLAGCVPGRPRGPVPASDHAAIEAALMRHIEVLASDAFDGRQPGTEGEAKTLRYLAREWQDAGLETGTNDPANPWFAPVELALSTPDRSTVQFTRTGRPLAIAEGSAVVFSAGSRGLVERAPVIFVGEAGERLDSAELAGRVALMLWDHTGQVEQREALLRGGAAAVLAIVKDSTELATLAAFRRRGGYRLAGSDGGDAIDGYLTQDAAKTLIGADRFGALLHCAGAPDFRPITLDATATIEATSAPGTVRTHNLIARLPGRKPDGRVVVLLAHWDHFGQCAQVPAPDLICNGAVDNASGLAVLTELAKRLAAGPRLDRDVYFLATTAEEWGLLGAQAFADDPPVPLDSIVAALNLDTVAVAPANSPVAIVGKGLTGLDKGIEAVLLAAGRREADGQLAHGYVRRQDGWALLRRDVPAVSVTSAFALQGPLDRYLASRYHLPSDEAAGIELGGAADDLLLHLALVRFFADPQRWPGRREKTPVAP